MRSRVSRKKRKIVIISALLITVLAIFLLIMKLPNYTKSLKLDFDSVMLNCESITILSDGNFEEVMSDGSVPAALVTPEAETAIKAQGIELCAIWLEYTINSQKELDVAKFAIDVNTTRTAKGILYSYTPVEGANKTGDDYVFRQAILIDKVDVKSFLLEKELPRPFKGSYSFELTYGFTESDEIKKIGFNADNLL